MINYVHMNAHMGRVYTCVLTNTQCISCHSDDDAHILSLDLDLHKAASIHIHSNAVLCVFVLA